MSQESTDARNGDADRRFFRSVHQASFRPDVPSRHAVDAVNGGGTLVVVFGAAVREDGSLSPALARRVGYALAALEADPASMAFLSGGVGDHPPSEATVMARLLDGSVSADRLTLDETSMDTLETVRAASRHARAIGCDQVLTCTDAYHQPRVRMLFRLLGLRSRPVRLAPTGRRRLRLSMWLREGAALPYDLVAGLHAALRDRRGAP